MKNAFGTLADLETAAGKVAMHRLDQLEKDGVGRISDLPFSVKVLLESLARNCDDFLVQKDDVKALANWRPGGKQGEVAFMPARVLLQDLTGVPAVVDLAAMRSAMGRLGGDPKRINPLVPVDLVIDHSVQIDKFGTEDALAFNVKREFERNGERYEFLKWGRHAFENFRVVPPATGIVHQVNLEFLASVVATRKEDGRTMALPDSLVGTDSHTTMINGIGVVGWGVGGIEAEACMLGQPIYLLAPRVVGFRLHGDLPEGVTATDLVLTVTEILRNHGVVGKFVEFFGDGLSKLSLADRATIANMAPEYGATMGFFPVDDETLAYMRGTGRSADLVDLTERYAKEQGLFRTDGMTDPRYDEVLDLDMGTVVPSIAGPKRPQDRIALSNTKKAFWQTMKNYGETAGQSDDTDYATWLDAGDDAKVNSAWLERQDERRDLYTAGATGLEVEGEKTSITHGAVTIASITSCTNTSNPSVMLGAGILAKKAAARGLTRKPWVKTSLAPGSKVVSEYLEATGLLDELEKLGFNIVGFGCTTCIGNSGPLPEPVREAISDGGLVATSVLSGNRNFEGRVSPHTRANYLASPPLVVAYALSGTMDIDLASEPLGTGTDGEPVYLSDVWPTAEEVSEAMRSALVPEVFQEQYGNAFDGNPEWNAIDAPEDDLFAWRGESTYIQEPSFFVGLDPMPSEIVDIEGARCLAKLGDSVTTDHISPAGAIPPDSPTARFLESRDIAPQDFNTFGSRRGNHEVMVRGTFGNIRLKNHLCPGTEGNVTRHLPDGEQMSIFDAAMKYKEEDVPLVILTGKDYGMGSSRDWAAKGTLLLGVRAVVAASYERIHRSNLIGMGVLPLQFPEGQDADTLGLTGEETYSVTGMTSLAPGCTVKVTATADDGASTSFDALVRIDTPVEVEYYRHGGILQMVLRNLMKA